MVYAPLSEEDGKISSGEIKEINEMIDHDGDSEVHFYNDRPRTASACDICGRPLKDFSSIFFITTTKASFKRLAIECDEMNIYDICPACMRKCIADVNKIKEGSE